MVVEVVKREVAVTVVVVAVVSVDVLVEQAGVVSMQEHAVFRKLFGEAWICDHVVDALAVSSCWS